MLWELDHEYLIDVVRKLDEQAKFSLWLDTKIAPLVQMSIVVSQQFLVAKYPSEE